MTKDEEIKKLLEQRAKLQGYPTPKPEAVDHGEVYGPPAPQISPEVVQEAAKKEQQLAGVQKIINNPVESKIQMRKVAEESNAPKIMVDQVEKEMSDPKKLVRSVKQIEDKKQTGEKLSVKEGFLEALTFFLPDIGGAVIGGAFGSTEGALLGMQAGGEMGAKYREHQLKKEELGLKALKAKKEAKKKIDITANYVTEDGEPAFTRETEEGGVEFFDRQGKIVTKNVIPIQKFAGMDREERLSSQYKDTLSNKQLDVAIDASAKFRSNNKDSIDQLAQISNLTNLIDKQMVTPDQVATFNAKAIFGESRITDEDVKRAGIPLDAWNRFKMSMTSWAQGKLSEEAQKKASEVLKTILVHKQKTLSEKAKRQASSRILQGRTGLSADELASEFTREAELSSVKAPRMSAEQRKRLQELRNKMGR